MQSLEQEGRPPTTRRGLPNCFPEKKPEERLVTLTRSGTSIINPQTKTSISSPTNEVHTTKYNLFTFMPYIAFEQLQRGVNIYFLFSCLLMYVGNNSTYYVGTIKASSTFFLLLFMMFISACVSIFDDLNRRRADTAMNAQKTHAFRGKTAKFDEILWKSVTVGDILFIKDGEEIPADSILLTSSGDEGTCFVSTSSLDGETNLKLQASYKGTHRTLGTGLNKCLENLNKMVSTETLRITAEPPNRNIHGFKGVFQQGETGSKDDLDKSNFLLRGSKLQNTDWVVALVIYTGFDTRIMKNTTKTPFKQSHLEFVNNKGMLVFAMLQALISLVSCIFHVAVENSFLEYWYLYPTRELEQIDLPRPIAWWFTFFTLYSNMVPVSLYSSMEIVNWFQGRTITKDKEMTSDASGEVQSAKVRSRNLCQEIGQVTHIFSDKTGTLTKNKMTPKAFCAFDSSNHAKVYRLDGRGSNADLKRECEHTSFLGGHNRAMELMQALSVAHTVQVTKDKNGSTNYMAESPDEKALVEAAAEFGWAFEGRTTDPKKKPEGAQVVIKGKQNIDVLATNAFTSARSCMSVLVEINGECKLLVKGSDTAMLDKQSSSQDTRELQQLKQKLGDFASEGLRTLLVGTKHISHRERDEFLARYKQAKASMDDRQQRLDEAAASIEKDLTLIGVTAIEDELQDKVGETIEKIRMAGIKLWVLTGDKLETARTIGYSTKVLRETDMKIVVIDEQEANDSGKLKEALNGILNFKKTELARYRTETARGRKQIAMTETAIMITGKALMKVTSDAHTKRDFLRAANACSVVIACRVAPRQKADLVDMVRHEERREDDVTPNRVTLAIGDGANDVPMIQRAEVGVGIYGREGHQAVNSADFALAEFQFLATLVLVHGRWNYRRTCKFILFTFWRCAVQVLLIFYFTFYCGFAATNIFNDDIRLSYNVILSVVICATGIFDRDVSKQFVLDHPKLYAPGPQDADLNPYRMLQQIISSFCHSIFIWLVMYFAYPGLNLKNAGDLYTFGTAVWTVLIFDCQLRGMFLTITWTKWNFLALFSSSLAYLAYLYYFCEVKTSSMLVGSLIYMGNVPFALTLIVAPLMGLTLDNLVEGFRIKMFPEDMDIELTNSLKQQKENLKLPPKLKGLGIYEVAPGVKIDEKYTAKFYKTLFMKHCMYQDSFGFWDDTDTRHFQLFHTDKTGARIAKFVAPLFFFLGAGCVYTAGKGIAKDIPYGNACQNQTICSLTVTLDKDMEPPISVLYKVDPFYQNYKVYADSYSMMELKGLEPSLKDLTHCLENPTTMFSSRNASLVPCGLISASVFNDTFSFSDDTSELSINVSGIARPKEVKGDKSLFQNSLPYPKKESNVTWLYERYPGVISEEDGVRDEKFAVWNRISAFKRVTKPYGHINVTLSKGNYTLKIMNRFNPGQGAEKHFVLLKETVFGGPDASFGYLLLVFSFLSAAFGFYAHFASQQGRKITAEEAFTLRTNTAGPPTGQMAEPLLRPGEVRSPLSST